MSPLENQPKREPPALAERDEPPEWNVWLVRFGVSDGSRSVAIGTAALGVSPVENLFLEEMQGRSLKRSRHPARYF